MSSSTIPVILIDDHTLFREGLRLAIEEAGDFQIAGECESLPSGIALVKRCRPAVAVANVQIFRHTGLAGVQMLSGKAGRPRIIVVGAESETDWPVEVILTAVQGALSRRQTPDGLVAALRAVARGGSWFDAVAVREANVVDCDRPGAGLWRLSPRQRQVVRLMAAGKSSKEIAMMLDLTPETVRTYRRDLMKRLSLSNLAQVTRFAAIHGLLDGHKR